MRPQHNAQFACSGSNTKRQRTDDPTEVLNVGPPTKISKTSSGPVPHQQEQGEEEKIWNDQSSVELEKVLNETLKSRNSAFFLPYTGA
jgi:hypothetical protein